VTSLHKRVIESHLLYQQNPCLPGCTLPLHPSLPGWGGRAALPAPLPLGSPSRLPLPLAPRGSSRFPSVTLSRLLTLPPFAFPTRHPGSCPGGLGVCPACSERGWGEGGWRGSARGRKPGVLEEEAFASVSSGDTAARGESSFWKIPLLSPSPPRRE